MATFPDIRYPIYPIQITTPDIAYKGQVENMTLITRKKTTKVMRTFTVNYKIPTAEYLKLEAFFDIVNCADIFEWVNPETKKKHNVRFAEQLDFISNEYGQWTGSIKLQES